MAGGYGSGPGGGAGGGLLDEGSISGAGTVMSQMRALFTPPGRDARRHQQYLELAGTSVELHPYYRRPGTNLNIYDGMRAHFQRFFFWLPNWSRRLSPKCRTFMVQGLFSCPFVLT